MERTYMAERAAIGTRWRRRRDSTVWRVRQSHRKDRVAELEPDGALPMPVLARRVFVSFADLRDRFEQLQPARVTEGPS